MIIKRPTKISKQLLVSLVLVITIALTTVISAQAGSLSEQNSSPAAPGGSGPDPAAAVAATQIMPKVGADVGEPAKVANIEPRIDLPKVEANSELNKPEVSGGEQQQQVAPKSAPSVGVDAEKSDGAAAAAPEASTGESGNEASRRKGRAETSSPSSAPAPAAGEATGKAAPATPSEKAAEKPVEKAQAKLEPKASIAKASKPQALAGKSGAKSKLPANLGTVTSTGSGGPAHYMSKHDAYSAIAEKHGALAQDALRKSDKRSQLQGFGSIQKASGLGDMFSPLKGVGDSGLARTLGASMRSIMKSKYSVPAYVASALLGAVALMAFYESPISPLPVPPLPEPPVGRFPPEMPNLSPNLQVPFRTNQQQQYGQQNYNQRSYNGLPQQQQLGNLFQQQQPQQVLFPASNNAQQRQMSPGTSAAAPGAAVAGQVQQLAANLLSSVGKPQIAQRKSGPDYESISRSLFSSSGSAMGPSPKMSGPANHQQKANSFLGFFGLGGSSSAAPSPSTAPTNGELQQASAAAAASSPASSTGGSQSSASPSSTELKNQAAVTANGLSNSHLVNKVKSYFSRASPASQSSSGSSISSSTNSNSLDQYQRMSFVQALMKDTAFLPAFLTSNRKSSSSPTASALTSKPQSLSGANPSSTSGSSGQGSAAARMQVDGIQSLAGANSNQFSQAASSKQRPAASSGYGLVGRTADRIAHALLETFTSGIAQRSAGASIQSSDNGDRKYGHQSDDSQSNPAASLASSLLSDLVSKYGANVANSIIDQSQQSQPEAAKSTPQSSPNEQSDTASQGASARSDSDLEDHSKVASTQQGQAIGKQQQQQMAPSSATSSAQHSANQEHGPSTSVGHVRKTRSIGFEYPVESNQELAMREHQPSKAAQINNVIDFVADSYTHNRLLFNFVMNQVGLSQAVPYVEQILASGGSNHQ